MKKIYKLIILRLRATCMELIYFVAQANTKKKTRNVKVNLKTLQRGCD